MRRPVLLSILLAALFVAASASGIAADASVRARAAATPVAARTKPPKSLRLYIFDCGTIAPMDPTLFGLKPGEVSGEVSFVTPCYLVVHPKGSLIWDVVQVPDERIPDDGTEVSEQGPLKAKHRLGTQLAAVGRRPKDITYIAMSHYHIDHTANANLFAGSAWIVQQAEYDSMFTESKTEIRAPETYKDLKNAHRITLHDSDYDVFGDGTVIIKSAPGHTPGHQMLFLKLAKYGPLLLGGDLYHLPEERALDRVPGFDFDPAMTRVSRRKTEEFLRQSGAELWIQHDPPTYVALKQAPDYYE
jgi:glyoxylase-like metal-dependent hydrolase (beta-lactamase superfamily II)